jgi:uncharacterized protein
VKLLIRLFIRAYQLFVSPILSFLGGPGSGCRFEPSCSRYFLEAVETHGALRGSWLGIKRLMRCQPWGGLGFDPVPPPPRAAGTPRATQPDSTPGDKNHSQCCKSLKTESL